jgi:peptidoglycan/xylan/chitin deacetylase (PgdA/CDA1 family)
MFSTRSAIRAAFLTSASYFQGLSGLKSTALRTPRVQFLYLHHVFPHEESSFRFLLSAIRRYATLISYSEAVRRVVQGEIDRPYVSLSFDDGFQCCLRASQILDEFATTACFFVCPQILDEQDPQKRRKYSTESIAFPRPVAFLAWDELDQMVSRGHEVGAHTLSHVDLGHISHLQLQNEVGSCRDRLQAMYGEPVHFAWPRGRWPNLSCTAMKYIAEAGFVSCASAVRGCHTAPPRSRRHLCIRRDHVLANWPISHIEYFMTRNALRATNDTSHWPRHYSLAEIRD